MNKLAGAVLLALLAVKARAEHQREWKRRRPTLRVTPPTLAPVIDGAQLIQALRKLERAQSIEGAVKKHLDEVMGEE